ARTAIVGMSSVRTPWLLEAWRGPARQSGRRTRLDSAIESSDTAEKRTSVLFGRIFLTGDGHLAWEQQLEELARRHQLAEQMGGAEKLKRHRDNGRLPVRERIDKLLDPGSFRE